jgi:hypothetical protein
MACGAIIAMAALAGCGSSGSDGAGVAGLNGIYGPGGPYAAAAARTPTGLLAGTGTPGTTGAGTPSVKGTGSGAGKPGAAGRAAYPVIRVDGSVALEGTGGRVSWLTAIGAGVSVNAPRSVRAGNDTPADAATGFYQAFYGRRLADACGYVAPSQRADCPARLAAASSRAGSLRSPAIGLVVVKGAAAIVTMTGVVCGPNGTRASHCLGQYDPQWVFARDYPFDELWDRIAQHGGNPLTATPFQRVAGRWYLDLAPAPSAA